MLAILLLLAAAPAEDLPSRLRHLESAAAAWAPAPSPDGSRIAFLTTLFGTRQAASMAAEGGYPLQLTDEPGGVDSVRYVPADPSKLVVVALRDGRRRVLIVDEEGTRPEPLDPAAGDQLVGGFGRDGKRLFYAVVERDAVSLKTAAVDTGKITEIVPPPASAGVAPPANFPVALTDGLRGIVALGPPAPDGRSVIATVHRESGEALVLVDVASARAAYLTAADKPARIESPRFTRDSKTVHFLTDAGRKTMGIDSIALPGRARKTLFAPPQDIDAFALTEDGHRLAVATESGGEDLFSLLELPSLRPQPLAAPPAGALAQGEFPLGWDRAGERLFFSWRLPDDTTDLWQLRFGYGTAVRLTRSPRPGLPRDSIPRPAVVRLGSSQGWLWKPPAETKPRLAILVSREARPVFDKRIAALNFAGFAVLAIERPEQIAAALQFARSSKDLEARDPLLLDLDGAASEAAPQFAGVVGPGKDAGLQLDPDQPDLNALVKYAQRTAR